jgi:hypothetical protein
VSANGAATTPTSTPTETTAVAAEDTESTVPIDEVTGAPEAPDAEPKPIPNGQEAEDKAEPEATTQADSMDLDADKSAEAVEEAAEPSAAPVDPVDTPVKVERAVRRSRDRAFPAQRNAQEPDAREPTIEWLKGRQKFETGYTCARPYRQRSCTESPSSALFYLTFWELKLYDISTPKSGYAATIETLNKSGPGLRTQLGVHEQRNQEEVLRKLPPSATDQQNKEQRNLGQELKREIGRIKSALQDLPTYVPLLQADEKKQEEHVARVLARCKREKDKWISTCSSPQILTSSLTWCAVKGSPMSFSRAIVHSCLRQRAPLSPGDALYCGQLLLLMHRIGTPDFNIPQICDWVRAEDHMDYRADLSRQIFHENLGPLFIGFTEPEARNYGAQPCSHRLHIVDAVRAGIFLSVLYGACRKWAKDEATYTRDALGGEKRELPGFLRLTGGVATGHWVYTDFVRVVRKWQDRLHKVRTRPDSCSS